MPATPEVQITVVQARGDARVAATLRELCVDAGLDVREPASGSVDATVVLISGSAVRDPSWRDAVTRIASARVVPIIVDRDLDDDDVPASVASLNWIEWHPESPSTTFGYLMAALYADPAQRQEAREIREQAAAWEEARRSPDLLISDLGRAEHLTELLDALEVETANPLGEAARPYLTESCAAARRERRRRCRRFALAGIGLVVGIAVVAQNVPEIRSRTLVNRAAIATAGDEQIIKDQPEWAAANAAALLVHGTRMQKQLARTTIGSALAEPWPASAVDYIDSQVAMVPFDRGRRAAVLAMTTNRAQTGFVVVDVRGGRWEGYRLLDGRYRAVDLAPDERTAYVAGDGAAAVAMRDGAVTPLASGGPFTAVRAGGATVALAEADGTALAADRRGRVLARRRFDSVLQLAEPRPRRVRALVVARRGRVEIVDLISGRVFATTHVGGPRPAGAVSPTGDAAIVTGADGQFWRFGAASRDRPTGIPVPAELNSVAWARGDRFVVLSASQRGQVFALPGGEPLGHVCWGHPDPGQVQIDRHADVLACGADGSAVWPLPAALLVLSHAPSRSQRPSAHSGRVAVETNGSRIRVVLRGANKAQTTSWFVPLNSVVTAAAVSPSADQIAVGSESGQVATFGLVDGNVRGISLWSDPVGSPIVDLRWKTGLTAVTAASRAWEVPTCPGCQTDAGLLRAMRARASGCLSARQLQWVDDTVRRRIGAHVCPPMLRLEGR